MPVFGGAEAYNECSLSVKYGIVLRVHPFCSRPPGRYDFKRVHTEDSGNARANTPNASKERNLRDISKYSRVLFERILGTQGFWRVTCSNRLKATG